MAEARGMSPSEFQSERLAMMRFGIGVACYLLIFGGLLAGVAFGAWLYADVKSEVSLLVGVLAGQVIPAGKAVLDRLSSSQHAHRT